MTQYKRPDETVFASGAKTGEVENFPDIARGWGVSFDQTNGIPPMEWFNALFKRNDEALRYLLQRGIAEWSATEDYPVGAHVQEAGKVWRAKISNLGRKPSLSPAEWGEAALTVDAVNMLLQEQFSNLGLKERVRVATTTNIVLSGMQIIDGLALTPGDRVLVKDQVNEKENGIYIAAYDGWFRSKDADTSFKMTPGMLITVEAGNTFEDTVWGLTTCGPIVLGTTSLIFELMVSTTATQADAEGGLQNTKRMTPLRVFNAIRSAAANATESLRGVIRVGSQAEVNSGVLDDIAVTPKKLRTGFSFMPSTNGYLAFPSWLGGFILQWGRITITQSAVNTPAFENWYFPIAFPGSCFSTWAFQHTLGGASNSSLLERVCGGGEPTATGASFCIADADHAGTYVLRVFAIGN